MIKALIQKLFGQTVELAVEPRIERVVNIICTKDKDWREGYDTNSIFRVIDKEHEKFLLRGSEFIIEAVAAEASILTCCLNRKLYEYGCYSATDIENYLNEKLGQS